jgi:hypothetical protein
MRIIATILVFLTLSAFGAIQKPFSGNLSGCVFTPTDPLNGSYTGNITGGTGEMVALTSASGNYTNILNPDGTVYVLTVSTAKDTRRTFTIKSNHLVNLATGVIAATTANGVQPAPTTYTSVTLVISKAPNKGTYVSRTSTSGGTTNAYDLGQTQMNISGGF